MRIETENEFKKSPKGNLERETCTEADQITLSGILTKYLTSLTFVERWGVLVIEETFGGPFRHNPAVATPTEWK